MTLDKIPIKILQAQYEYYVLKVHGRDTCKKYSDTLHLFFKEFSDRLRPEDFFRMDILDWQIILTRQGYQPYTVNNYIYIVSGMWQWMIDTKGLPLTNIASVKPIAFVRARKNRRTLAEFQRLAVELHDPKLLKAVKGYLTGEIRTTTEIVNATGASKNSLGRYLLQASKRAGLEPVSFRTLERDFHQAGLALLAECLPDVPEGLVPVSNRFPEAASLSL